MKPSDAPPAQVLGFALRTWATLNESDHTPVVARLQVRQPPGWGHVETVDLTGRQCLRIRDFLRNDLAEYNPGHRTREEAAAVVETVLHEITLEGRNKVTAADLVAAAPRIGRSRAWIAAHVSELVDAGRLVETCRPGVFRIVPPVTYRVRPGSPEGWR